MYSLALGPGRPSARTVRSAVATPAAALAPPPRLRDLRDGVALAAAQLGGTELHHEDAVLQAVHPERLERAPGAALHLEQSQAGALALQRLLDGRAGHGCDRLPVAAPLEHDLVD